MLPFVTKAALWALGLVLLAGWMLVPKDGDLNFGPGASFFAGSAGRAAVRSYEAATGHTDAHIVQSVGWRRCAVVTVMVDASEDGASLAMVKRDGDWVVGRTNDQPGWFDSDDVATEEDCLDIASGVGRR
jgi:hypothetical protein